MSNWQSAINWQSPITPAYVAGAIIIEIDDGFAGVYSHWFPLCRNLARTHNQWSRFNAVVCCPAINTVSIDTSHTYMTHAQLQELSLNGWEIMSHGRAHTGIGEFSLTSEASAGQKVITLDNVSNLGNVSGYTFKVTEGEITEEVSIVTINTVGKTVTVANNLANTYSTNAKFSMTVASLGTLLQGCVDDLSGWNLDCKHHVYTYYTGSQHQYNAEAVAKVKEIFESARGVSGDYNTSATDKHLLKSRLLNDDLTEATINTILDATLANDCVTIFYGHGETTNLRLAQLEYLIEGAFTRGIKILTRSEALERLL